MFHFRYQFKPKLLPSLVFLVLFPFLLSLGFWQLGRMDEKQDIIDNMAAGNTGAAQEINEDFWPDEYSKVMILGKFLPQFSVLLEHQQFEGKPGYHVLTPFEANPQMPWVLVNRGWISVDNVLEYRESLAQSTDIVGLAYYPSEDRFILGENLSRTSDGQIKIQRVDFAVLSHEFHHELYPFVLLLDPNAPNGFVRNWQIKTMPPSKHFGYAVQWFALAATLLLLYLFYNFKRKSY